MTDGYATYMPASAPSWLQGPNGTAFLGALGMILDDVVTDQKAAAKQGLPGACFPDALPLIGAERLLDRSPVDTDAQYAMRLSEAFAIWPFAGSAYSILTALAVDGFTSTNGNPTLVQQNGLYYQLDAGGNLVVGDLGPNPQVDGTMPLTTAYTSWWTFDAYALDASRTQFASRFALLFPSLGASFITSGRAVFDGTTNRVAVTWAVPFSGFYDALAGAPVITDGTGPILVALDGLATTSTGTTVVASAPFVGYVDVVAYEPGANPLGSLRALDLLRVQSVLAKWRAAKASCLGIYILVQGAFWGWPLETWGSGGNWGPSTVVAYPAQ